MEKKKQKTNYPLRGTKTNHLDNGPFHQARFLRQNPISGKKWNDFQLKNSKVAKGLARKASPKATAEPPRLEIRQYDFSNLSQ